MNPPKNRENSITRYYITEENLVGNFHIRMTQTLESEVSLMCNLSKGVEEKGIQKGIVAMVSVLKELQIADDIILSKIREKFDLTEETAETYLKEIT